MLNDFNRFTREHIVGSNNAVGTTLTTVWGGPAGLYPWLTAAGASSWVSSNAGDTGVLRIRWLDASFNEFTTDITMNGIIAVAGPTLYRVNDVKYFGNNAGDITGTVGANTISVVKAGRTIDDSAVYTVPAGYRAFLNDIVVSTGKGADATASFFERAIGSSFIMFDEAQVFQAIDHIPYSIPKVFGPGVDIEVRALASAGNNNVKVAFNLALDIT